MVMDKITPPAWKGLHFPVAETRCWRALGNEAIYVYAKYFSKTILVDVLHFKVNTFMQLSVFILLR